MPFQLQYFPEAEFMLIRVDGDVSLVEYREANLRYLAALEQVETNVDVLVDLRRVHRFPTSISQLREASIDVFNPKIGWIVLLTGDKPLLKFIATVLTQLLQSAARMRVFDTLEGAINFLKDTQPAARQRANWFDDFDKAKK